MISASDVPLKVQTVLFMLLSGVSRMVEHPPAAKLSCMTLDKTCGVQSIHTTVSIMAREAVFEREMVPRFWQPQAAPG
jgi:hypothetical protein